MDRVWKSYPSQTPPVIGDDAPKGYPTDGSAASGIEATVPGAHWYHSITMEILNVIKAAGLIPDRHALDQLAKAIKAQCDAVYNKIIPMITGLEQKVQAFETFPPGMVATFATPTPPAKWLICDGRAVSRKTYSALFAAIGTSWGTGDGSTTFNLPNYIDKVAWGAKDGVGESIEAGLPNIEGTVADLNDYDNNTSLATGAFRRTYTRNNQGSKSGNNDVHYRIDLNASWSNPIYGRSTTVQPPALKLLPCIHI